MALDINILKRWHSSELVLIGGSAGSFKAIFRAVKSFSVNLNKAVIIIIHRKKNFFSEIEKLFAENSRISLREICDKEEIRKNTIYIAPANYHVLIEQGPSIALSVDPPVHYARPSIDVLFESAADVYRSRLAGVVLTGGNDDGAEGLEHIRRTGGLSIVQDPSEAQTPLMPEAALKRGPADIVLPLDVIADLLAHLIRISCKPAWP